MQFTTTYFNFRTGRPDHIISGSNTGKHTPEEIVAGIRAYVDGLCPLEDRVNAEGIDTLLIREGVFFPTLAPLTVPTSVTMRYS